MDPDYFAATTYLDWPPAHDALTRESYRNNDSIGSAQKETFGDGSLQRTSSQFLTNKARSPAADSDEEAWTFISRDTRPDPRFMTPRKPQPQQLDQGFWTQSRQAMKQEAATMEAFHRTLRSSKSQPDFLSLGGCPSPPMLSASSMRLFAGPQHPHFPALMPHANTTAPASPSRSRVASRGRPVGVTKSPPKHRSNASPSKSDVKPRSRSRSSPRKPRLPDNDFLARIMEIPSDDADPLVSTASRAIGEQGESKVLSNSQADTSSERYRQTSVPWQQRIPFPDLCLPSQREPHTPRIGRPKGSQESPSRGKPAMQKPQTTLQPFDFGFSDFPGDDPFGGGTLHTQPTQDHALYAPFNFDSFANNPNLSSLSQEDANWTTHSGVASTSYQAPILATLEKVPASELAIDDPLFSCPLDPGKTEVLATDVFQTAVPTEALSAWTSDQRDLAAELKTANETFGLLAGSVQSGDFFDTTVSLPVLDLTQDGSLSWLPSPADTPSPPPQSPRRRVRKSPQKTKASTTKPCAKSASPRKPRATSSSKDSVGAAGPVSFVNFTAEHGGTILRGVAPSGSNKTKAKRAQEAAEQQRRIHEEAERAVLAAGGDVEGLRRLRLAERLRPA